MGGERVDAGGLMGGCMAVWMGWLMDLWDGRVEMCTIIAQLYKLQSTRSSQIAGAQGLHKSRGRMHVCRNYANVHELCKYTIIAQSHKDFTGVPELRMCVKGAPVYRSCANAQKLGECEELQ